MINNTKTFKSMTNEELIQIARECHTAVYVSQCYGSSDMLNFLGAAKELANRGFTITDCKTNNRLYIRRPC